MFSKLSLFRRGGKKFKYGVIKIFIVQKVKEKVKVWCFQNCHCSDSEQ